MNLSEIVSYIQDHPFLDSVMLYLEICFYLWVILSLFSICLPRFQRP